MAKQNHSAKKPKKDARAKPAKAKAAEKLGKKPEKKPEKKSRPDLTGKVTHLIAEEMAIEEAELTPNASFREDLNLDDIDVAELLMQAETAFGLNPFSEADWESCETVGDFTQLIEKRVATKRARK